MTPSSEGVFVYNGKRVSMKNLVVLISGWTGQPHLWRNMSVLFQDFGYDVVIAEMPNNGFGDIQESACNVALMIQEVRPYYDKVVLCGHSMGGLIARVIIQHLEVTEIDAYVSLGTPHQGTHTAKLAPWSESAKQMCRNSLFIDTLNEQPWPEDVPALGLQAQFEAVVLPRSSAKIDFGLNQVIPGCDHVTLPLLKRTFFEIWGWLTYSVFEENGPSERHGFISNFNSK